MKRTIGMLITTILCAAADDPSRKPVADPSGGGGFSERWRILADLDGDGADDMLLSGGKEDFGTMGGPWVVHLRREGKFVKVGEVWAHPGAIAIEPDQARSLKDAGARRYARIWVYLRSGGSAGSFGYYRVGEESVDAIRSIEIYPGDGGTITGNAIYKATFRSSPIALRLQRSATGEDGEVTWTDSDR